VSQLWIPASACPHPRDALRGEMDAPKLSILCHQCGAAWNQDTVPGSVIDTLQELLDEGRFKPRQPPPIRNHDLT
jgi:hypothetical protein